MKSSINGKMYSLNIKIGSEGTYKRINLTTIVTLSKKTDKVITISRDTGLSYKSFYQNKNLLLENMGLGVRKSFLK